MAHGAIGVAINPAELSVLPVESQLLVSIVAIRCPFPDQIADPHALATKSCCVAMTMGFFCRIVGLNHGLTLVVDV